MGYLPLGMRPSAEALQCSGSATVPRVAKSQPFSLRLSPIVEALVSEEAQRTQRSKGAIVEALTAEALKARMFPGVAFRGVDWERRAWVIGTALDVWEIIAAYQEFGSVESMIAHTDLTERHIRLALAYYERLPAEIDEAIGRNRRSPAELRSEFPTIDMISVPGN